MVENFYHNTVKEIQEVKTKICNKETEAEEKESKHRIDVKVFLQKVTKMLQCMQTELINRLL